MNEIKKFKKSEQSKQLLIGQGKLISFNDFPLEKFYYTHSVSNKATKTACGLFSKNKMHIILERYVTTAG